MPNKHLAMIASQTYYLKNLTSECFYKIDVADTLVEVIYDFSDGHRAISHIPFSQKFVTCLIQTLYPVDATTFQVVKDCVIALSEVEINHKKDFEVSPFPTTY